MKPILKKIFTMPHLNLFMVILLFILVAYPLFAPIVPAKYGKPTILDKTDIYAGKSLTYKLHSCRYVNDGVLTIVTRQLVSVSDPKLTPIALTNDTFTNPARCADVTRTLLIPYQTPEGTYQLVVKGVYSVIPLRSPITVTAKTDSFKIKAATTVQDIQALIDMNNQLHEQIKAQIEAQNGKAEVAPVQGSSSVQSPSAVAPTPAPLTIAQTVPAPETQSQEVASAARQSASEEKKVQAKGSGSEAQPGLLQGLLKALGVNLSLSL